MLCRSGILSARFNQDYGKCYFLFVFCNFLLLYDVDNLFFYSGGQSVSCKIFIILALRVALNTASSLALSFTALAETAIAPKPEAALRPFLSTSKAALRLYGFFVILLW